MVYITQKKIKKRLDGIFYNDKGEKGAYSSNINILKKVYDEKYDDKISIKAIKKYTTMEYVYQRHRNRKKKFSRNIIYSPAPGAFFGIDLADFSTFKDDNEEFRYMLLGCDFFSKMVYIENLKKKDQVTVLEGFKKMLPNIKHRPLILCSDLGGEFVGKIFQAFLKKNNIGFVALQGQYHNAITERAIKSIKSKIGKTWTKKGKYNWIKYAKNLVTSYNNTYHSAIKTEPIKVDFHNSDIIHDRLYSKKLKRIEGKFKINDMVRFSLILDKFKKGYEGYFSKQTFLISKGPFYPTHGHLPMYKIVDSYDKTKIPGSWYENELLKIDKKTFRNKKNTFYDIHVLKEQGDKSYIHFVGWPKRYDHWTLTKNIKNLAPR